MKKQSVHVPLGYALTLTPDAYASGNYVRFQAGGGAYTPAPLSASTAVTIGPFNEPRDYDVYNLDVGEIVPTLAQSGVFTGVDGSDYAPIASPTFTGTTTIPKLVITKANGTEAANAVTASGSAGVITTSALTTAAASSYAITWTNTSIAATSVVLLSLMGGTNTVKDITLECVPGAGTATLTIYNDVLITTALDGTVKIGYQVI